MLKTMMRAVRVHVFGGPEVLKIENIPKPKAEANQVLIKIIAAGINPVDTYIRAGVHMIKPELPYTPGGDCAGIVEAVGSGVHNIQVGQRVYTTGAPGTYAEYVIACQNRVFPLADKLTFEEGAGVGVPYFTAYRSLIIKGQGKSGETVLIHGASGGVGIAAIQLAKAYGLTVYATVGTKEGEKLVRSVGADQVFNHREKDYVEKIVKAMNGKGFELILEMLANINLVPDLAQLAGVCGRVIVVGSRGSISEFIPRLFMGKEIAVIGCALFLTTEPEWVQMSKAIIAGSDLGFIKPVIDKQYGLDDVTKAHHEIINSTGAKGKLIIKL